MVSHHRSTDKGTQRRVVYSIPDMEQTRVESNITYKTIEDKALKLDIYYPAPYQRHTPLPAVILVHGDGPTSYLEHIKDSQQYTSWGKLIAASGLIAITANHRSTRGLTNVVGVANDVDDLISYVREQSHTFNINPDAIGIWTCSAGTPFALRAAFHEAAPFVRAIVCYYGFTELKAYYDVLYTPSQPEGEEAEEILREDWETIPQYTEEDFAEFSAVELLLRRTSEIAPMFIARAGMDYPELNTALDAFITEAIAQNSSLTLINHPTGQHAFDIQDNDIRSEEIIAATLEFLQTHLLQ